ncbi:MFS transporter [Pseudorhodoferax sp. Leaf267]|uniref:MFS transporter n=1 Tax=Pseudorhodoferax sp. Leaf267 TaxID=1736316 RepID=UPI0006FBDD96|nr:MFS transporter [Pseudorhodoferax sp. Leaf267]KQP12190.1 permease [Pseudorhodoferax sp. Leaf267]
MPSSPAHALRALVFAFGLSQFFRGCLAVIAPELQRDLGLSAAGFGSLSSCFFLACALAQIPVGIAFDRYGVGRPTRWLLALGVVSAVLFVLAPNGVTAMLAQAGLGAACAPVFMGLMHYAGAHLPAERYVPFVGRANAIGMVGALCATAPLGWLAQRVGWRLALSVSVVCMAMACWGVWRHVRDAGPAAASREPPAAMLRVSLRLLVRPVLWTLIPLCIAMAAGTAFRNAWGGPYLADMFGLDTQTRGLVLTLLSVAGFATALLLPVLVRRSSLRRAVLGWGLVSMAGAALLALWPGGGALALHMLPLAVLATFGMVHPLVMTHGRELLPATLRGRGLGVLNTFVFLGAALASWAFGLIADAGHQAGWTLEQTWSGIFVCAGVLMLGGLLAYVFSPAPGSAQLRQ